MSDTIKGGQGVASRATKDQHDKEAFAAELSRGVQVTPEDQSRSTLHTGEQQEGAYIAKKNVEGADSGSGSGTNPSAASPAQSPQSSGSDPRGSPRPVNRPTTSSPPPLMHPTPTAQAPLPLVGRMPWRFERPALLRTHLPRLHLMGLSRHDLPPAIQGWMVSKHQTPMAPLPQAPGGNPHL